MKRFRLLGLVSLAIAFALAASIPASQAGGQAREFKDIVQEIKATIEPAEAKPGQTVTWKLTVKLIPGWHTYPVKQVDKNAADSVTKFDFGELKKVGLSASGAIKDPPKFLKKAEPEQKIKELRYYEGEVTWTQQLRLATTAKAGTHKVPVKVTMQVCDEKGCLPPETVTVEAEITVK